MYIKFASLVLPLLWLSVSPVRVIAEWNYHDFGPDVWSDQYPLCNGQFQSPINIKTICTTYQLFPRFQLTMDYNVSYNFTLTNNGHSIVAIQSDKSSSLSLNGGGLNGTFQFVNFHLHWGENYKSGSEHQINGEKFTGEIHFVYRNPITSQIAVLGMFMKSIQDINSNITNSSERRKRDNSLDEWERYFAVAKQLQQINDSNILDLSLASLMGNNLNHFWRYNGSFTVPPCTEGIIWTVFRTPIVFTENELDSFRKNLYSEDYRGPQPLYNRIVYRNFLNEILSPIPDYNYCFEQLTNNANTLGIRLLNKRNYALFILIQIFQNIFLIFKFYF